MYNHLLDTFLMVAKQRSISKAAHVLYISKTAVMKQINMLEDQLGLKLFERSKKGVWLTAAGESVYRDAEKIKQLARVSLERAVKAQTEADLTIHIATSPLTPINEVMSLWPVIKDICPELRFEVLNYEQNAETRMGLNHLGEVADVGFGIYDGQFMQRWDCNVMELKKEPICCAVPIYHELAGREKLRVDDFCGRQVMLHAEGDFGTFDAIREDFRKNYPQIEIVDLPQFTLDMFEICERNNYLLLFVDDWKGINPLIHNVPVDWEYDISFGMFYASDPSPKVRKFIQALRSTKVKPSPNL